MSEWVRTLMIVCDLVVCVCFLIMPWALQTLFRRHRIGHVLDGWFNSISAVFLTCALYRFLNAWVYLDPTIEIYQAMVNVLTAVTAVSATTFLLWRERKALNHPEEVIPDMETALQDMRRFVALRGVGYEPNQAQQRES